MVNNFQIYPYYCLNCGSSLVWQNDFTYEDVYPYENREGLVTFHMCSNEECGIMIQADISEQDGMERLIPFSMEEM